MPIYTPGKLTLAKAYVGIDDPDAQAYIAAVEAADQIASPGIGALETATKVAIHSFVKGCKNDGIWTAIKVGCILAGAKTHEGAFIDLKSSTKLLTNNGFIGIGTDYVRKTGLLGNGTTKYLNSNRNNNADPQDSNHNALYVSTSSTGIYMGMRNSAENGENVIIGGASTIFRNRSSNFTTISGANAVGFIGMSRLNATTFDTRVNALTASQSTNSNATSANPLYIFVRNNIQGNLIDGYSSARLAFYSIGESLDLALLDTRVSALITAIGAAF
tara:strand:- start:722 stop:1543 length:822 start_codon:yes stop_codon:yes gene_type:complete